MFIESNAFTGNAVVNTKLKAQTFQDFQCISTPHGRHPCEWNVPQEINLLLTTSKSAITKLREFTALKHVFPAPGDQLIMEVRLPRHFTFQIAHTGGK
jgi:hypothetical protein